MHFELSDLSPKLREQAMKKIAEEDARARKASKRRKPISVLEAEICEGEITPKPKEAEVKKRKNKYNAQKLTTTLYDGTEYTFDSRKEYRRYQELEVMQLSGEITDLRLQVPYELIPKQKLSNGKTERAVDYIADFFYRDESGNVVVEDVKGFRDGGAYRVFVIKRKLMKYIHGIEVHEI